MGVTYTLLACINFITLCISIPFLIVGSIIKQAANSPCDPITYKPLLAVGGALFIISFLGMLGGCFKIPLLLWLYTIALFIFIVGLLASLAIGGAIVKGGAGNGIIKGHVSLEETYDLRGFSDWLKKMTVGSKVWVEISQCMSKHKVCNKMNSFSTVVDFMSLKRTKISPIEIGCCKPPGYCGFELEKDAMWKIPEKGLSSNATDCKSWDNDRKKVCYSCESCKAGYLAMFVQRWRKITILNAILLLVVLLIFMIALCALC